MTTKNFIIGDTNNINNDERLEDKKQKPLLHTGNSATEGKKQHDQTTNSANIIVSIDNKKVNNDERFQPKIIKLSVDNVGYNIKPKEHMGAITNRIADPKNVHTVDLIQLSNYITSGHAFTISYAEGGMSDNNFVSADLVGLDFDGEKTVTEVLEMLKEYDIPANIVYYTYSHGEKDEKGKIQERFRVITALNERITDKNEYKQIIKGYQFIFGDSTDNATVGAVQRFLGTNKGLVRDVDPYNTASKQIFLKLYQKKLEKQKQEQAKRAEEQVVQPKPKEFININGFDLSAEIDRYNLLDYIKQVYPTSTLKPASGGFYLNPCPICNSNDHLHITGNKFHSFGNKDCLEVEGIGIVQWLMYIEKMSKSQAVSKFKYDLLGIDEKQDKRAYAQAMALKEQEENRPSAGQEQERPPFIAVKFNKAGESYEQINKRELTVYIRENVRYFSVVDDEGNRKRFTYINNCYIPTDIRTFGDIVAEPVKQYNIRLVEAKFLDEVVSNLDYLEQTKKIKEINSDSTYVNMLNGIVNVFTGEVLPHTPDMYITRQLPCTWLNEIPETPVFDKYMNDLTEGNEGIKHFLMEYMGCIFSNVSGTGFKQALFQKGKGNTGKSQLKLLVEKILGSNNYTSIDLKELEEDKFSISTLYNKRLAGSSDMKIEHVKSMSKFKALTGGDNILIQKKFGHPFNMQYDGFLWFCTNKLPTFGGDKDKHVYERMLILEHHNVIPVEKRDPFLIDKLLNEKNGIVMKCIITARNAIRTKKFTIPPEVKINTANYALEGNSVARFLGEAIKPFEDRQDVFKKQLYDAYKRWYLSGEGTNPVKKSDFYIQVADLYNKSVDEVFKRTERGIKLIGMEWAEDFYRDYKICEL